jgi:hypothetical protein
MAARNQQECPEQPGALDEDTESAGVGAESPALLEFTAEERERLRGLRRLVAQGDRSDFYPIDKRQDFARWLIEQGKLSDN